MATHKICLYVVFSDNKMRIRKNIRSFLYSRLDPTHENFSRGFGIQFWEQSSEAGLHEATGWVEFGKQGGVLRGLCAWDGRIADDGGENLDILLR